LLSRRKFRGRRKIEFATLPTVTGYNLVRMRNLRIPVITMTTSADGRRSKDLVAHPRCCALTPE
jgi:hypothetical protein